MTEYFEPLIEIKLKILLRRGSNKAASLVQISTLKSTRYIVESLTQPRPRRWVTGLPTEPRDEKKKMLMCGLT
jgi:hypothetical protein